MSIYRSRIASRIVIRSFQRKYRFLSNFWPAQIKVSWGEYASAEHAYVAAKTDDEETRLRIQRAPTAGDVKRLGRRVLTRSDWHDIKLRVMNEVVRAKFFQNPDLAKMLLDTGKTQLIEGNTWGDTYWGVCRGIGENHLGKILMTVREELQDQFEGE